MTTEKINSAEASPVGVQGAGEPMHEFALLLNRLILVAGFKAAQTADTPEDERFTDADVDSREAQLKAMFRAALAKGENTATGRPHGCENAEGLVVSSQANQTEPELLEAIDKLFAVGEGRLAHAVRDALASGTPAGAPAVKDDFNGDTPHLIACINALLELDAKGALTTRVVGHARTLLSAAASRLGASQGATPAPDVWRQVVQDECTILSLSEDGTPREVLKRVIAAQVQIALDPAVSSEAQALIDRGATPAAPSDARDAATEPTMFYLATHKDVTPSEDNEPRLLKAEHVDSYRAAGWVVVPALTSICPHCEAASPSPREQQPTVQALTAIAERLDGYLNSPEQVAAGDALRALIAQMQRTPAAAEVQPQPDEQSVDEWLSNGTLLCLDCPGRASFMCCGATEVSDADGSEIDGPTPEMIDAHRKLDAMIAATRPAWKVPEPVYFEFDKKKPKPDRFAAYTVMQLHQAYAAGRASLASPSPAVQEADTRDAARYRWLRDRGENFAHENGEPSPWAVIGTCHNDHHPCSYKDLDEAIDAAMSQPPAAVKGGE